MAEIKQLLMENLALKKEVLRLKIQNQELQHLNEELLKIDRSLKF